jgi:hypothetical protein
MKIMTTTEMLKASNVELFSLLLSLANVEGEDAAYECVQAILADRGIKIDLTGFEG